MRLDTVEIIVQCRKCKALETLYVVGNTLERTRNWHQSGSTIYHSCQGVGSVIAKSSLANKE